MRIYPEDKETLLNGTSLVRFKIEILKDGKIVKTLDENSIVDLDLEDFRYVDSDSLVVGQFVAKKVTGELDKVYDEFSIEDTEIALRMGVSYNNDNRFEMRNIASEGGNAVTCTDQTAIPTPAKPVPFKPLHGKIPLYVNWSGKDNDVTLDEIDLGDITLELFSMRTRTGAIRYYPDIITYDLLDTQQWILNKRWASITGADILNTYNSSTNPSQFIKYDADSKAIYINFNLLPTEPWENKFYTNLPYANRVRSNYFPSAHYAETPDGEENIQGVDGVLEDNTWYITIRYDSLFTDVDSFIAWLKEHQDLEIKHYIGSPRIEITEEDYPELYKQLQQILVSGTTYYYLGKYLVTKPTTDDVKSKTTFEALDYTKKFNKKFDPSGITFPCTAFELADYCCKKCGVYLETYHFTNADFEIKNNQYDSDATYRNVMQDIGKLAYSWVRINDNNDCVIDFYVPTEDDFDDHFNKITGSNYYDLSRKEKPYGPVNRVVIGLSDIEGENVTVEDTDSINKNGVCELKVMDNNLTYTPELRAKASEGAKRLFGLTYLPLEITTTGHPWLEGNDLIEITTPDGNTFTTLPFDRTLTYAGHIKTKITSKGDTALETAYKSTPSMESEIKRTRYIVDKDGQRITELVEKSTKQDQQISELTISVDNIESKVRRTVDLTTDGTTEAASLNLARVNAGAPLEVTIHPIDEDISYLYPSKDLFPSDLTFLKIRDIQFTNTTTKETFTYTLPMDLWYLDKDTYDEFHLDYATSTCEIIQRVDWNNNQDKYKLDKEVIHIFEFPKIDLTSGDYTISLPGYDTGYIYAKLMVQNQITNQYATKAELNSKIEQSESDINIQVSAKFEKTQEAIDKKANSNDVNAQLELKVNTKDLASEIDAVADKINLTGLTTVNKNFQILKDGSIVAKNGSFTGNIYLNDGSRVIGGNGLLSVLDFYAQGPVGFDYADYDHIGMGSEKTRRLPLIIYYNIPDNFTITQAYAIVEITAVYTAYRTFKDSSKTNYADDWTDTTGVAKQLNLYKGTSQSTDFGYFPGGDAGVEYSCDLGTKIPYGFGTESYTPRLSTSGDSEIKTSVDLVSLGKKNNTDYLEKGFHTIGLATDMTPPVLEDRLVNKDLVENTCLAKIYLYVYGYMTLPQ